VGTQTPLRNKISSVVCVPSVDQEDARRLHRKRHRLIRERVQHVNRIKGLCATQGIYDYEPLRPDRKARPHCATTNQHLSLDRPRLI